MNLLIPILDNKTYALNKCFGKAVPYRQGMIECYANLWVTEPNAINGE